MAKGRSGRLMGIVGGAPILGAATALVWNEWQLARRFGALDAALAAVVSGAAVHFVGEATARTPVRDPAFAITADALRLDRTAETFQWREEREGSGGDRVVRYEQVWSPVLIRSDRFLRRTEHVNPAELPVATASFPASDAMLVGSIMSPEVVAALPASREIAPEATGPVEAVGRRFMRQHRWLYSGDPTAPVIGDVRVRFDVAPEGLVSLVAAREAGTLVPFVAGKRGAVVEAAYGEVSAEALLRGAARGEWGEAWAMRGFGTLLAFIGTIFTGPTLAARLGSGFKGRQRILAMLSLALGVAALACGIGWVGARLLLGLGPLAG